MLNNLKQNLEYLTDTTFSSYYHATVSSFPDLCALLDEDAIAGDRLDDYVRFMNSLSWEFEDLADGGRGVQYRPESDRQSPAGYGSSVEMFFVYVQ